MTSRRTELNWGMLEKAAAELPDSLSGGGAAGAEGASTTVGKWQTAADGNRSITTADGRVYHLPPLPVAAPAAPDPPPLLERPGATGAAAAATYGLGALGKRLGEVSVEFSGPGMPPVKKPFTGMASQFNPAQVAKIKRGWGGHSADPTKYSPEFPEGKVNLDARGDNRIARHPLNPAAKGVDATYGQRPGTWPHRMSYTERGVHGLRSALSKGRRYKSPAHRYSGTRGGRLSRLPGALKGVGGGLGLLSLYNLMRGSESD